MEHFTPLSALAGGVLIGLAIGMLWLFAGRIGGVSGIFGGIVPARPGDLPWRLAFLAGLPLGAALFYFGLPHAAGAALPKLGGELLILAAAGLLVGIGTRVGGGCTSGHGVCGLARLSTRSFAAVATFMASGAATVFIVRHVL